MGDIYKYPVFFECSKLSAEQRKRIENYFHIRRKSGGGECGSVTDVNDKVYSVAFKERDGKSSELIWIRVFFDLLLWKLFWWHENESMESESKHENSLY